MHIYNSNHYSSTIKQIINDCLHSAKENPFAIHYVIVDDPKYYEEIFLKHTDTIFNIELMTLSSFYQKLLQIYHQDFRKKTDIQNLLEIIKMNKEDHRETASCGTSREAREYRVMQKELIEQGKFREAVEMDINDIRDKFGDKYDNAISQMLEYVDKLEAEGKI